MSNFPIIDLVVGMFFIYFLLSIICSSVIEIILTTGKYRAKMLSKWLLSIFDKEITTSGGQKVLLGQAIMDHCSTTALSPRGEAASYIDARNFTEALLEKITYDRTNPKSIAHDLDGLVSAITHTEMLPPELQRVLLSYASEARSTYESVSLKTVSQTELFRSKIENWYDTNMQRVSGSLKTRFVRRFTFWTALIIAIILNADTISIAQYLYSNPAVRARTAAQAYAALEDTSLVRQVERLRQTRPATDTVSQTMQQLTDTIVARVHTIKVAKAALEDAIPIGWSDKVFKNVQGQFSFWLILSKIAGLLFTILAMMMGAPFWFDLLNKIANLRGNGKQPPAKDTP